METKQPVWKYAGHLGDVDPIAYGGGFVYTDETGVYGPEMVWFEPGTDEQWHETEGETPLQVFRVLLERPESEWWFEKLEEIASYTGLPTEELILTAKSDNPVRRALIYSDLISYFGAEEFDSYPVTMTEDEAYERYAAEMKASR